jgi:hypothetical protein
MMVGDALDGLARLVVKEEDVALFGDVPGGLGVADKDEAGGAVSRHAQGYMGSRSKPLQHPLVCADCRCVPGPRGACD